MMLHKQKDTPTTYPVKPDRELLVWEKWITIRKEETTKLSKHTSRPPVDLVMNLCENIRPDKERKIVLEEANIEKKVKIRGSLWEQAPRLKQRCYCEPVYEIHRTPAEMGRPRKIVHMGVPTYIQAKELGCAGDRERAECNLLENEYHLYRDRREKELQKKILKLDPFRWYRVYVKVHVTPCKGTAIREGGYKFPARPEIGPLMVKGINPPPPVKMPHVPYVKETIESAAINENLHGVYALRINNSVFLKSAFQQELTDLRKLQKEPWYEDCTSWSYYLNVAASRAGVGKLYLQNLGTVTIRYCWKRLKKGIPFIPEENDHMFFFNKNEDLLSPGQEKYISFIFVSDKPGIYKEHWELSLCNINFFDTITDKLVVHLLGDSIEDVKTTNTAIRQLEASIYLKSIVNDVTELIENAKSKAVTVQPRIYPYKKYFLEAEMFVMKNPVCFYHQTEVANMKQLYAEMSKGNEWDLSIASWRELMLTKEFDDRMKYCKLLQKSHSDFLKPWYEGDDLLKSKYGAMRSLLGGLADQFYLVHDRITSLLAVDEHSSVPTYAGRPSRTSFTDQSTESHIDTIRNLFYIQMLQHVGDTMEACAGILSSLDLDRWIDFDFCQF